MIKTKKRFKRFNTADTADVAEYEDIINDSLCTITSKENVTETTKNFDDEGKLSDIVQRTVYLVHWEEQVL